MLVCIWRLEDNIRVDCLLPSLCEAWGLDSVHQALWGKRLVGLGISLALLSSLCLSWLQLLSFLAGSKGSRTTLHPPLANLEQSHRVGQLAGEKSGHLSGRESPAS